MKERRSNFPIKLTISIVIFITMGFLLLRLAQTLKNLDYFRIEHIVSDGTDLSQLSHLKGQNIFTVDLKKESVYISELYSAYKKIRLSRILPNYLRVDFVKRKPQAYIKLYKYLCVDEDLVLFDMPDKMAEPDLPLITGLETKIFGPKGGSKYNISELALAIDIIKEAKMNRTLKDYKIKIVNVPNINNASFFISEGLEIKIGAGDIKNKIDILGNLLIQAKKELVNIKYIDLRFKEAVIKFKNAK